MNWKRRNLIKGNKFIFICIASGATTYITQTTIKETDPNNNHHKGISKTLGGHPQTETGLWICCVNVQNYGRVKNGFE